jgi:hypothetical protein
MDSIASEIYLPGPLLAHFEPSMRVRLERARMARYEVGLGARGDLITAKSIDRSICQFELAKTPEVLLEAFHDDFRK